MQGLLPECHQIQKILQKRCQFRKLWMWILGLGTMHKVSIIGKATAMESVYIYNVDLVVADETLNSHHSTSNVLQTEAYNNDCHLQTFYISGTCEAVTVTKKACILIVMACLLLVFCSLPASVHTESYDLPDQLLVGMIMCTHAKVMFE